MDKSEIEKRAEEYANEEELNPLYAFAFKECKKESFTAGYIEGGNAQIDAAKEKCLKRIGTNYVIGQTELMQILESLKIH